MWNQALLLLLHLYPRDFRKRFGEEMVAMVKWRMRRAGDTPFRAWTRLLRDTLKNAPTAHATVWRERLRPRRTAQLRALGKNGGVRGPLGGKGSFSRDVHFGVRGLARRPGFALAALATLAIGIGANTAVYSLLHTLLFEPLPYRDAQDLVYVVGNGQSREESEGATRYPDVREWPGIEAAFAGIATFSESLDLTFRSDAPPERVRGAFVSSNFTRVLGMEPILGPGLAPENELVGAEPVVLIGESLWRSRLGADPEIVGKVIDIGEASRTVVGVMPDRFRFPEGAVAWIPNQRLPALPTLLRHFSAVARLAPGLSVQEASERARASLRKVGGPDAPNALTVQSLRARIFGNEREPLLIFYGVVSLVLLVACVNVGALFLARNESRRHEFALRAALGASRLRIVREALSEGLLLVSAGGALGVALGWYGRKLILAFLPPDIPPYFTFNLQPRVLLSFAGIVTASAILFAWIPAFALGRLDGRDALASAGHGHASGSKRKRLWTSLVVLEVTVALAVLVSADLVVTSAVRQGDADTGIDSRGVVTLHASPSYTGPRVWDYYQRVMRSVAALPGFTHVSLAWTLPTGRNPGWWSAYVEGWQGPGGQIQSVQYQRCGPDYFSTLGIPILEGREFTWGDDMDAPWVVAVNRAFAERYWPGESPVGKRVGRGGPPATEDGWYQVVALVGDSHNRGYGRPASPQVYLPFHQSGLDDLYVVARTGLAEGTALRALRQAVAAVDPTTPLTELESLDQAVGEANWQVPFSAWAFGLLSLITLTLAATGVYGLVAFTVRQRSRELAVRVALGARRRELEAMVLREGLGFLGAGVVGGTLLAFAGAHMLASLLFGVSPMDPGVVASSAAVMTVIVLLAEYLPVREVVRRQPLAVLGKE